MIKLENLKDGMILKLDSDIENPNADRRVTRDWTQAATLAKGTRFIVREDWEWVDRAAGKKVTWYKLEKQGERHPGLYRIPLHAKPHGPEDTQWFLGQAILRNASEPALTYADRWAQLNMEHANDFRVTLEVLIANGELSWTQIENANKVELCAWCDTIAIGGTQTHNYCAAHEAQAKKEG